METHLSSKKVQNQQNNLFHKTLAQSIPEQRTFR